MTESFFTIATPSTGLYKEKGSKFLSFAHPVADSEQINLHIGNPKKNILMRATGGVAVNGTLMTQIIMISDDFSWLCMKCN